MDPSTTTATADTTESSPLLDTTAATVVNDDENPPQEGAQAATNGGGGGEQGTLHGPRHRRPKNGHCSNIVVPAAAILSMLPAPSAPRRNSHNSTSHDRRTRRERAQEQIRSQMSFSLKQCLMAIFCYIAIAVIAYTFVFNENWTVIDSVYFSVVTFTSVGYGDLVPSTRAAQIFTCFFALSSIACLGIAIGALGNEFIAAQQKAIERAKSLSERNLISLFTSTSTLRTASTATESASAAAASADKDQKVVVEARESPKEETPAWVEVSREFFMVVVMLSFLAVLVVMMDPTINIGNVAYFLIITSTTCGFGDVAPTSQGGRLAMAIFIPLAVGAMGRWLSIVAGSIIERQQRQFRRTMETKDLTEEDLEVMDADGDGNVTLAEFLEFMLVAMDKVDRSLIDQLRMQFDKLDADGTGVLSRNDLIVAARKKLKDPSRKMDLAR